MSRYEQLGQANEKCIHYDDIALLSLHERITRKGELEDYNWRGLKFFFGYIIEYKVRIKLFAANRSVFTEFYKKKEKEISKRQLNLFGS